MKNVFTKTILLIAFLGLSFNNTNAQYVTIPDANFVAWLNANYPNCMNGNLMDTTCNEIISETQLNISNLGLSDITGIHYFVNLQYLECFNNQISFLPNLPDSLIELNCGDNPLNTLPLLPNALNKLICYSSNLSTLPMLPPQLTVLRCQNNQLTQLPLLPTTIIDLFCNNNLLTSLPPLPPNLPYLYCYNNNLTSLPSLPSTILSLNCGYNQLAVIPILPNSLVTLICTNNLLVSLPTLPNSLKSLHCSDNQLNGLPNLPGTLTSLLFSNNNISCLPTLPNILLSGNFNSSNNPFSCVPNFIPAMDSASLAMPLCQNNDIVNNPNGCGSAAGISGLTYFDDNQNCILGANEPKVANIKLNLFNPLTNQFGLTYTNGNGYYNYPCLTGTYFVLIDTLNKPYIPVCNYPGIDTMVLCTSGSPFVQNVNFDIACKLGVDIGVQSIMEKNGVVFPGQQHAIHIILGDLSRWYGLNCSAGTGGDVTITIGGPVTFIGADSNALVPSINGNIYSYSIPDFGAVNYLTDFQLLFLTNTSAQAGEQICVHIEIAPDTADINLFNNNMDYCYQVVNSYDPNYKEVYPTDVAPLFQDWLTYTIHFQNLGTAPAINIRLLDTLDSNLDAETFEVINYSHYNTVTLMDGILDFRFPNILLPDSASNPTASQGFVQYRIKPKANLGAGTQIENTAHIYFDYNPAVVTNTTVNNFITTVSNKSLPIASRLWLYPNPSTGIFNISASANIEVYNLIGDLILSENNTTSIDLTAAPKGMYYVKLNGGKIEKLIKN